MLRLIWDNGTPACLPRWARDEIVTSRLAIIDLKAENRRLRRCAPAERPRRYRPINSEALNCAFCREEVNGYLYIESHGKAFHPSCITRNRDNIYLRGAA